VREREREREREEATNISALVIINNEKTSWPKLRYINN
jgi:hypothetical protein